jgi:hypothetical protein
MHRGACILIVALAACTGSGGGGASDDTFTAAWRYEEGSFSFVNCYTDSRSVDLTRTGFQIVDDGDALARVGTDGCRFTLVPASPTHARGVAGETCTVDVTDPSGQPIRTRYEVRSWIVELEPSDAGRAVEVFDLVAETTTALGTIRCEVSGNNTLERVP